MTFRAKPVVKRAQKPSWESRDRKNFYLNLGFGLVVAAAVLILAVAVGLTYYNDHLASVGTVDGQAISKDELRDRAQIESWRLEEATRRITTQKNAGRLTESQAELQLQIVQQQTEQIPTIAFERIVDNRIQADLAVAEGVTVSEPDVDAQLAKEATTPEGRHAWVIELAPEIDADASEPTPAQVAAARTKADGALRELTGGKAWDEVAKTVSTDASTAPQAGDLGWLNAEDVQQDEPFLDAIFAAEVDTPTAVIEGDDGIFRIGRVTEIAPETVDDLYTAKIVNDGLDLAKYRNVVRGDVVRQKLEDKVVADATKPGPQRQVREIYLSRATADLPPEAVKVRHILYSPNDDPAAAQRGRSRRRTPPGRRPRPMRTLRTQSSSRIRASSMRSPEPRATRGARSGRRAPAASWTPMSAPTAAMSRASRPRSWPPTRRTARSCHRSRPNSAGMSSRSSIMLQTWRRSRRRWTAGPISPASPVTSPKARRPAAAATSAGWHARRSTHVWRPPSSRRRSARPRRS